MSIALLVRLCYAYSAKIAHSAVLQGILIVTALHCWKGFMQPLVVQCVTIPVTLLESPLFQVYILKKAATGSLVRPWKEESPFAA